MTTLSGLDVLRRSNFEPLFGKTIGVLCNQASLARDARHILELLLPEHLNGRLRIGRIYGPQHGLYGHTQDNMIEWEGATDPRSGIPVVSLYGQHREPTAEMLEGIDLLVVDLQDVGARYYTFIWTLALCMKKCGVMGIPIMVLDRPNPLGGIQVEGTVLQSNFSSFVGLHPLPMRHGMTIGEIAKYFHEEIYPGGYDLQVVQVENWNRADYWSETQLPWGMPSPNMPTIETAVVYPGGCLLEATNLSEGRGTTRPFEIFGAPWLDGWKMADKLNDSDLTGCHLRPLEFQPTFQKHAGQVCSGCFLHVTDRKSFEPVLTFVAIMQEAMVQGPFEWKAPPYEYEYEKLPIDILAGNEWLRRSIEEETPLSRIRERMIEESNDFEPTRTKHLLYALT